MRQFFLIFFCATALVACNKMVEINNELTPEQIEAGVMTPEVLWKLSRVGSMAISSDGSQVVFALTKYKMEENKGYSALYIVGAANSEKMLTDFTAKDSDPVWMGDKIYFLSTRSGETQLWSVSPSGKGIKQISQIEGGIEGYGIAPNGEKIFYTKKVQIEKHNSSQIYADMDKSKAKIYDDLMSRHWDHWNEGLFSHIFIADLKGDKVENSKDIMEGEPWDAPLSPYFDNAEISWSNNSQMLAYTCKKLTGREYAISTDSDIYLYDLGTESTKNLTQGMVGYDKYPTFSPNDKKIAFRSMATPGYESDKDRLFVLDLESGQKSYLTELFDYNATDLVWSGNDSIYFISPIKATHQLCVADMSNNVKVITNGDHDIVSLSKVGERCVVGLHTISRAKELYNVDIANGSLSQLTDVNGAIFKHLKIGDVEKRWVTTTDGEQMLTWVVKPIDFDSTKRYPVLLYCQGGPQSVVSQFWSYRWNFQLMASQGYIVVAPNRRGLPSFGQKWLEQISGDYSGQNIKDYLSAIDDVAAESWADESLMGAIGASYGGYSVYYLAGHHDKRFKALISHCGVFNMESKYLSTEEMFFPNHDYGGAYWEKDNATAQRTYANSPHKFVDKWDTPILIFVGQNDFRIPYTESLQAYNAARLRNIDARLVFFEDEAHQIFKPQNSIVWNREFFGWLDKYLKR